jgi:hypothetical protein
MFDGPEPVQVSAGFAVALVDAGIGMLSPFLRRISSYLLSLIRIGQSPGFRRCETGSGYGKDAGRVLPLLSEPA